MSNKVFHAGKRERYYREKAQKYWNIQESKLANERRIINRIDREKKYDSVCEILVKEIVKRPNIEITYRNLLPVIKDIIETSKYLSSRFSEKDLEPITVIVVKKAHALAKEESKEDIEK